MLEASPPFDLLSSAEFYCDRCGYTGAVQQPFNGCPDCRETSTLRLLFSPNLQQLRELFVHSDSRKKLAALNPFHDEKWISLGEGHTGLVRSTKIGPELGISNLYFKNECCNPTGSFKDRYVWLTTNIARMIG